MIGNKTRCAEDGLQGEFILEVQFTGINMGLKRGTVRLEPYNTAWAQLYAQEETAIKEALGGDIVDVQHIGSTAAPGLDAKPIIDIAIGVADLAFVQNCVYSLARLGYEYLEDRENSGDYFFAKGPDKNRTHYVHMVLDDSQKWKDYLLFRNTLRRDFENLRKYNAVKHKLAKAYAEDRKMYTDLKGKYIDQVLKNRRNPEDDTVNRAPKLHRSAKSSGDGLSTSRDL